MASKATTPNPKDLEGMKKPPLRLFPPAAIIFGSRVMELGAKKYGPYNWRSKAVKHSIYLEAALRHILQALDGEKKDPDSGVPHEAHALSCMAIILDAMAHGNMIDDLPDPGPAAELIKQLTSTSGQTVKNWVQNVPEAAAAMPMRAPADAATVGETREPCEASWVGIGAEMRICDPCKRAQPGHTRCIHKS
jgi:hypothetical protein